MAVFGISRFAHSYYGGAMTDHPYTGIPNRIIWYIQVDWDLSGEYALIEPQTIISVKYFRGRKNRILNSSDGQEQPDKETSWIEMLDADGRYDSFNQDSPLYDYLGNSGQTLKLWMISTTTEAVELAFVGTIVSITYDQLRQVATIIGEGLARQLQIGDAEHVYNACQPFWLGEAGWDSYFTLNTGNTPFPVNWWSGRPDGLYLRKCVQLLLDQIDWPLTIYTGETDFNKDAPDYFFLSGESAWSTLKELADGFAARLFFLRDGRLMIMDRQDVIGLPTDDMDPIPGALVKFGLDRPSPYAGLRNWVEVQIRPRAVQRPFKSPLIEAYYREVWSNAGPIAVPPSSYLDFDIEYLYNGQNVVGSFVKLNFTSDDYEVWSQPDRTGTDMYGGNGYIELIDEVVGGYHVPYGNNQSRTRIRFSNDDGSLTAYFFDVKVFLVGIFETGQPAVATVSDAASITLNRTRKLSINSRWVQTTAIGQAVAQAYVDALSTRELASPSTLMYHLGWEALFQALVNHDLGTMVDFGPAGEALSLANFGLWGQRLIVAQALEWSSRDGETAWLKVTYERLLAYVQRIGEVTTYTQGTGSEDAVIAHVVPIGLNRCMVISVALRATQTVSDMQWGTQEAVKIGAAEYATGNYARAEIWAVVNPDVGSDDLAINLSGVTYFEVAIMNFVNVRQTSPVIDFTSTAALGGANASLTGGGNNGDLVIGVISKEGGTITPTGTQTPLWAESADGNWKGAGGIGSVGDAISYDLTGSLGWVLAAATIKSVES